MSQGDCNFDISQTCRSNVNTRIARRYLNGDHLKPPLRERTKRIVRSLKLKGDLNEASRNNGEIDFSKFSLG